MSAFRLTQFIEMIYAASGYEIVQFIAFVMRMPEEGLCEHEASERWGDGKIL